MSGAFHSGSTGGTGLSPYLRALRIHWLKIAAVFAVVVAATGVYVLTATKQYEAEADIQVQPLPTYSSDPFQGFSVFRQSVDGSSPVVAAARAMQAQQIKDRAYAQLGAKGKGVSIAVTPLSQADIVAVTATAPGARLAAQAANTYAQTIIDARNTLFHDELTERIRQIKAQIAAIPADSRPNAPGYSTLAGQLGALTSYVGAKDPTVQQLTSAFAPASPSWPRPTLSIAVAAVLALLLGFALAIALELVNVRVAGEDELTQGHRLPILARIPRLPTDLVRDYMSGRALLPGETWKGYRTLRAVLASAGADGNSPRSIMITSGCPGDGKTLTAVNLAITLAAGGQKVTLVDGDFYRPMIASIFNVPAGRNTLSRVLLEQTTIESALVPAPNHPRLSLLLSSSDQTGKLSLLESERIAPMLDRLKSLSDVIVIDSPPIPEVAEALALAEVTDAVIAAVRLGATRRDKLGELRELLSRRGVSPLGFVVTTRERPHPEADAAYGYPESLATTSVNGVGAATLADGLELMHAPEK